MRRSIDYLRGRPKFVWRMSIIFLAICIIMMCLGEWIVSLNTSAQIANDQFRMVVNNDITRLQNHFEYYANTLYAGQSLFGVDNSVSRQDWSNFITAQHITARYPGVYGLGYISAVNAQNAPALLAKINSQLRPNETPLTNFYPVEKNSNLAVVTYVAPDTASQAGIGYNILSDSNRAAAVNKATINGTPTATAHVIHLQGDPLEQRSLIIFLPIYNNQLPVTTPSQRQAAILGYVDILLHVKTLLNEVFSTDTPNGSVAVRIQSSSENIYSFGTMNQSNTLKSSANVIVAGQSWHIVFDATKNYGLTTAAIWLPRIILISVIPILALCLMVLYLGFNYQVLKKTKS